MHIFCSIHVDWNAPARSPVYTVYKIFAVNYGLHVRGEWVFMNQLRSGHCRTTHALHKCMGQRKQPTCSHCGQQPRTVEHLLHKCPVTRFTGSLIQLHHVEDDWSKEYEK